MSRRRRLRQRLTESGEDCDDGNTAGGDCCSATCAFETGACDDGNACTESDVCASGICGGTAVTCTAQGECHLPGTCDPATGACSNPPAAAGHACGAPASSECDAADTCDGAGSCRTNHAAAGQTCAADASECTDDVCDGAGACIHPAKPEGTACAADANPCTEDVCVGGACEHPNRPNHFVCDDDVFSCTDDFCFADAGDPSQCLHVANASSCDFDRDACTVDLCAPGSAGADPTSGCMLSDYKRAGTGCDDHNPCTLGNRCSDLGSGVTACGAGTKILTGTTECDGNSCTGGDTCERDGTCVPGPELLAAGSACDDGAACTENDFCLDDGGPCQGFAVPDGIVYTDGNDCTTADSCQSGACAGVTLPDGAPCDDGNRCTDDAIDACQTGVCLGGPRTDCSASGLLSVHCQPSSGLCCGKTEKRRGNKECRSVP